MVVPMASAAKAAREANGLVILQKGEAKCLEKIRYSRGLGESLYWMCFYCRRAADEMQDAPTSIMLKYLQVSGNIVYS